MTNGWWLVPSWISAIGSGLMAGLFFAFSTFVMRALARLPAPQGIAAMQSINETILNPIFLTLFLGTAIACAVAAGSALWQWRSASPALLVGSACYLLGVIAVTMICNVPKNEALAALDPSTAEAARAWSEYLATWLPWNHVRTVASIGALVSFIAALRG